jgi:hypothetical protein
MLTRVEEIYQSRDELRQLKKINFELLYMCAPAELVLEFGRGSETRMLSDTLIIKHNRLDVIERIEPQELARNIWPLMFMATMNGRVEIFRFLDARYDGPRDNFIEHAVKFGHVELLKEMYTLGYPVQNALPFAIQRGELRVIEYLLSVSDKYDSGLTSFARDIPTYELLVSRGFKDDITSRECALNAQLCRER